MIETEVLALQLSTFDCMSMAKSYKKKMPQSGVGSMQGTTKGRPQHKFVFH